MTSATRLPPFPDLSPEQAETMVRLTKEGIRRMQQARAARAESAARSGPTRRDPPADKAKPTEIGQ